MTSAWATPSREREARRKTDLARAGTHYDPAY
jgi:hypothetical protein